MCAPACLVGDDNRGDDKPLPGDDGRATISSSVEMPDGYDVCEHLPAEPPCSLICDRDALVEYVPKSACAVFVCDLTDGQRVTVHACHPPD